MPRKIIQLEITLQKTRKKVLTSLFLHKGAAFLLEHRLVLHIFSEAQEQSIKSMQLSDSGELGGELVVYFLKVISATGQVILATNKVVSATESYLSHYKVILAT